MPKHRAGSRRIISISIPENLAVRLDRKVGKGKEGRSATIAKMIDSALNPRPIQQEPKAAKPIPKQNIGIRIESDTMGDLEVPDDRYYGCQTARSLINFDIGEDTMPRGVIRAFGILKQAAAKTNVALQQLDSDVGELVIRAAQEVIDGDLDGHFRYVFGKQEAALSQI